MVNGQWLIVMPGTRYPNAEGHPPSPPFKGGKSEAKGGCYPFKGGECSAVSRQQTAFGVPCRGEPQCSPFFCVVQGYPNANFANGRESTQITVFVIPNTSSCHSEHSEESRGVGVKEKRFFAYALNDKLMVNC